MSYLDDFLAGRILNSSSNNSGKDDSSELKLGLLNEKLARQNAEAARRDSQQTSRMLLNDKNDTIANLTEDYNNMRRSREKFKNALNLEKEEKKALLSKPLYEAVKENENWDLAYDSITSKLATSHVFKEAYKELAIKYGAAIGLTTEEVLSNAKNLGLSALENRRIELDKMASDPSIKDSWYMCEEVCPKDRIERIIEKVKDL